MCLFPCLFWSTASSSNFFQTYGNFCTRSWLLFRRFCVWSGKGKFYIVEYIGEKPSRKSEHVYMFSVYKWNTNIVFFFTVDNILLEKWSSSFTRIILFSKDFGTGTFTTFKHQMSYKFYFLLFVCLLDEVVTFERSWFENFTWHCSWSGSTDEIYR